MAHIVPVITFDGPGGTGKSTISNHVAAWLDWNLLDSGAFYRALALAVEEYHPPTDNEEAIVHIANSLDIEFCQLQSGDGVRILIEGKDVSREIRNEQYGSTASQIATLPKVRAALLERQKKFRRLPGLIAEGRDMGTVVFTDALLKIYLTADVEERAKRRYKQLKQKGFNDSLAQVVANIVERDTRDNQRDIAPLQPAQDAVIVDTTVMDIPATIKRIKDLVQVNLSGAV